MKWAPSDIRYTLVGATSDERTRPVGVEQTLPFGNGQAKFLPIASIDPHGHRSLVPVTMRFLLEMQRRKWAGQFSHFDVLDFHRIDPPLLFRSDPRPKNIVVHQDMSIIRLESCDIMWRHAPWLYEWLEGVVFKSASTIRTVRQTAVERYKATYPELADRFSFLPTWFDPTDFRPEQGSLRTERREQLLQEFGVGGSGRKVIVSVGRLDKQKDPLLLIDTMALMVERGSDIHLVMVGDGILRAQVESRIVEQGLSGRVTMLGVKPPSEIARILVAADLLVLSSAYEGMPIAVLEALATGLPVVSTDVGEVSLVVRDGFSGYICRERSASALSKCTAIALNDPNLNEANCLAAIAPYAPTSILAGIYQTHRAQGNRGLTSVVAQP